MNLWRKSFLTAIQSKGHTHILYRLPPANEPRYRKEIWDQSFVQAFERVVKLRTVTFLKLRTVGKTQDSHFFKTQDSHFLEESAQSLVHQRQHPLNFSGCRVDGALR